jgi:hypothetical protein
MNVIATAKIIAAKTRPFDRPPAPGVLLWLIVIPPEVSVSWSGSHGMTVGRKQQLVNLLFGTTEQ